MINFIKKTIFGFDEEKIKKSYEKEISRKDAIINEKDKEISKLKANIYSQKGAREKIPINFKATVPEDDDNRKVYVSRVAGFYNDILKPRLREAISEVRSQLGKVDSTVDDNGNSITGYSPHEFDLLLKGTENALWIIDDWGRRNVGEYQEYQRNLTDDEPKSVKEEITT